MPKDFDDNVPDLEAYMKDMEDEENVKEEIQLEGIIGKTFKAHMLSGSLHDMMLDESGKPVRTCIVQFNALLKFSDFVELEKMANADKELLITVDPLQPSEEE